MKKSLSTSLLLFVAIFICGLMSTSISMPVDEEVYLDHQKPDRAKNMKEFSANGSNKIQDAILIIKTSEGEKEIVARKDQPFLTSPSFNNRPQYLLTENGWTPVVKVKEYGYSICEEFKARCNGNLFQAATVVEEVVPVLAPVNVQKVEKPIEPVVVVEQSCPDIVVEKDCESNLVIVGKSSNVLIIPSVTPMHSTTVLVGEGGCEPSANDDFSKYVIHSPSSVSM